LPVCLSYPQYNRILTACFESVFTVGRRDIAEYPDIACIYPLLLAYAQMLKRCLRWFLRTRIQGATVTELVEEYQAGVDLLIAEYPELITPESRVHTIEKQQSLTWSVIPQMQITAARWKHLILH
jgi:NAD-specific glutamate dehydrogenase